MTWSKKGWQIVADRQTPAAAGNPERVERRRGPRDPQTPIDWEQVVLQRMAGRVRSLLNESDAAAASTSDTGWEDAALRALQRGVRELDAKK
jgi:hypothetical protein